MFRSSYGKVFEGDANWQRVDSPTGDIYTWEEDSTYVKNPPYFEGMSKEASPVSDIEGARVLALLGDSVTTDHISPRLPFTSKPTASSNPISIPMVRDAETTKS
jgi:aconitate hydratase